MSLARWIMAAIALSLLLGILCAQSKGLISVRISTTLLGLVTLATVLAGQLEARWSRKNKAVASKREKQ
jgi:hypothetical protein